MKSAIEWFKEKGFTFDDKITIKDVIDLQNDAAKSALMTAQLAASGVIEKEATAGLPKETALDGLAYKVTTAIVAMADKLEYLPEAVSQSKHPQNGIAGLMEAFDQAEDLNSYLWFELGYTRITDWMVHVWDKRGGCEHKVFETQSPDRDEACRQAAAELRKYISNYGKQIGNNR